MDDSQLLNEYVIRNSETAFRTLVDRYAGTVYHIALRQTGNPHIAEEATQTVFITLAQKAPKISKGVVLYGWLFRATRFAVMNLAREAARRRHHEQEACTMQTDSESNESDPVWEEISPLLNDALEALSQSDRDVLMIRFFGQKSHRDLGQMLGVSEDTAKKRVSRAVEKLRAIFANRGVAVTSIALAAALSAHAAQAAPAGLAASVAAAAIGKGTAGAASATAASKGVANLMTLAKFKIAAMIGGAAVVAAGTTAVIADQSAKHNQSTNAVQGQFIAGQVLQPDGKPAAGVTIFYFHSQDEYVALNAEGRPSRIGRVLERGPAPGGYMTDLKKDSDEFISHPDAKTDADGRFSIPVGTAQDRGRNLVMLGDEGYAQVAVSNLESDPVTLKPWVKITGRLMIGDQPGANQVVEVGPMQSSAGYRAGSSPQLLQHPGFWHGTTMQWDAKTKTDNNGNFEFARIMPGDLLLGRYIELPAPGPNGWWNEDPPEEATGLTQTTPVHVKGGEKISVQLGGHGRTIVGRISKGDVGIAKWDERIYYLTKTVALPPGYDYWTTNDDETARFRAWFATPEGRAAVAEKRQYIMEFDQDGNFKVQDVQPGEYDFRVAVHRSFKTSGAGQELVVAEATNHFAVTATSQGQSPNTPTDIGTAQMEWIPGYIVYWLERGKLEGMESSPQRVRGIDTDAIAALDEQIKARQSVKPTGKEITIDLSRYVNAKLTDPLGDEVYDKDNNLAELPSGTHVFAGMPFDIRGIVQLNSTSVDPYLRKLPQEVTGINIGHKFKQLHLLHAQIYGVIAAVQDASLILHYADGTQAEIPIVCDVRVQNFNAFYVPMGLPDLPENSELAWIGSNPFMKKYYPARALHLYRTVFDNPHPDVEVASIDFISKMTPIAPFIAGLTLE